LQAKGDNALHVLMREAHCHGFSESKQQSLTAWQADQELKVYNDFNDEMLAILNHPDLVNGQGLRQSQAASFILGLYNLDLYRAQAELASSAAAKGLDDEALLHYAIEWFIKTILPVAENCER